MNVSIRNIFWLITKHVCIVYGLLYITIIIYNIMFLADQIHNPLGYVRDFYFFKRSQYPQLCLVRMKPQEAFSALQRQELLKKFVEIGKVHLTWAILKNVDMVIVI